MTRAIRARWLAISLALVGMTLDASAMSATVKVKAVRDGYGTTQFDVIVCVCLSAVELAAYNAAGGGGSVTVMLGEDCCVTENDLVNDDELTACISKGSYTEPIAIASAHGCPPAPPTCVTVGDTSFVTDASYGEEDPGDFQLGEAGKEEGTVPAGTSVTVTTGGAAATGRAAHQMRPMRISWNPRNPPKPR